MKQRGPRIATMATDGRYTHRNSHYVDVSALASLNAPRIDRAGWILRRAIHRAATRTTAPGRRNNGGNPAYAAPH